MQPQLIALILAKLDSAKTELITLTYSDYRALFHPLAVKVYEEIKDKDKEIKSVRLNRLEALNHLKEKHNFFRKGEIKRVITEERQKYVDEMG